MAAAIEVVGPLGVSAMARKLLATLKLALEHTPIGHWLPCAVAWREFSCRCVTNTLLTAINIIL